MYYSKKGVYMLTSYLLRLNLTAILVFRILSWVKMKAITQKIAFKMKKNKTDGEKAIVLAQNYAASMRELYSLLHTNSKLPKQQFIPNMKQQLTKLETNMLEELHLYQGYQNPTLQNFLSNHSLPNSSSLISIFQDKQNQIENLKLKLSNKKQAEKKETKSINKLEQIQLMRKHLQEQQDKKMGLINKVQKLRQQLELQAKNLIQNKISNFDQEIEYRKLEKSQNTSIQ